MDLQIILTILIIAGTFVFAGRALWKKTRAFSPKAGCEAGCGCSGGKEKLPKEV